MSKSILLYKIDTDLCQSSEEDKPLSKGKRSAANSEDGFDSEEDDSMPVAPRAKSGRTTKAMPTYVDLSDDDDDF